MRPVEPAGAQVVEVGIEAQHVEHFQVSVPDKDIVATRREQSLVLAFAEHLESQGHRVTRHCIGRAVPSVRLSATSWMRPIMCSTRRKVMSTHLSANGHRPTLRLPSFRITFVRCSSPAPARAYARYHRVDPFRTCISRLADHGRDSKVPSHHGDVDPPRLGHVAAPRRSCNQRTRSGVGG